MNISLEVQNEKEKKAVEQMNGNFFFDKLDSIPYALQEEKKVLLRKCGNIIKANVISALDRSSLTTDFENGFKKQEPKTNYDGTPYVHMRDDVKVRLRVDANGNDYVSVGGGKYTGFKWHLLNNGTYGNEGNHFVDVATANSEDAIEQEIDAFLDRCIVFDSEE